ncbi:MAG: WxcM-like domain-containing protein [Acidobacteria bacterium]|nr:WxcM-like domain-containing protein [Acidobacteriota bacterium]
MSLGVGASIGDAAWLRRGARIGPGVRIGARALVGAEAVLEDGGDSAAPIVECDAVVGARSRVRSGVVIGAGAFVAGGAVVHHSVPENSVVDGDPARLAGVFEPGCGGGIQPEALSSAEATKSNLVMGVRAVAIPVHRDARGALSVLEFGENLPFSPLRAFFVSRVPIDEIRGCHSHKQAWQFLFMLAGSCAVTVDNGRNVRSVLLRRDGAGLVIPPGVWAFQRLFSQQAVLAVLASHHYDTGDYVRDYSVFLRPAQR